MTADRGLQKSPSTSGTDPLLQGCIDGEANVISQPWPPCAETETLHNWGWLLKAVEIMERIGKGRVQHPKECGCSSVAGGGLVPGFPALMGQVGNLL